MTQIWVPDDQREPGGSGGSEHAAPEVLPGPILPHNHAAWGTSTSAKLLDAIGDVANVKLRHELLQLLLNKQHDELLYICSHAFNAAAELSAPWYGWLDVARAVHVLVNGEHVGRGHDPVHGRLPRVCHT